MGTRIAQWEQQYMCIQLTGDPDLIYLIECHMCQLAQDSVYPLTLKSFCDYIINHMAIMLLKMINHFFPIRNQDSGQE